MSYSLFAYGTLSFPDVLEVVIGRRPEPTAATLADFRCERFVGGHFPGLVAGPGSRVHGVVYRDIDRATLARLDDFEGDLYVRRLLEVTVDGAPLTAFTYLVAARFQARFAGDWDREWFARHHKGEFIARLMRR